MKSHIYRLILKIKITQCRQWLSYCNNFIRFKVCFPFPWVGRYDFQGFMSLATILPTFICFRPLRITFFHIFLGCSLAKLLVTLKVLHSLDQAFSSTLSRWPNHRSPLSCKHSLALSDLKCYPQGYQCSSTLPLPHHSCLITSSCLTKMSYFHAV